MEDYMYKKESEKIPKIIHYCWFGGKELSNESKKCIASWKKYLPDYEIIEWNETNYCLNTCDYVREAYQMKKWAFVSDYARFDILYKYGGLYFDTDVEIIKPLQDIIDVGPFMGMESGSIESLVNNRLGDINPGLGMGAVPGMALYEEILSGYKKRHFINDNGNLDINYTVCRYVTDIILKKEIIIKENKAFSSGIMIYPKDYFCPKDYETGYLEFSKNTHSIHHYTATWITPIQQKIHNIEDRYVKKFGEEVGKNKSKKITFVLRIINKIQCNGFFGTIFYLFKNQK